MSVSFRAYDFLGTSFYLQSISAFYFQKKKALQLERGDAEGPL
jgi:hypothetical protein